MIDRKGLPNMEQETTTGNPDGEFEKYLTTFPVIHTKIIKIRVGQLGWETNLDHGYDSQ